MTLKKILVLFISLHIFNSYSQKSNSVLFEIDDAPVYTSEFLRVYNKNLGIVTDENQKDINNYLNLFINYKLKIKQAYDLKFDTIITYKKELAHYKKQLMEPYLRDETIIENLVKEAYDRSLYEIKASHILIKLNPRKPEDTVAQYAKIIEARKKILAGEKFENVAKEYSQDPSVVKNEGNLGYFSAFNMVYPFETAAYKTSVGKVSMPFKTRFGYHIVKVEDKRDARGEVEASHIMAKGTSESSKIKIDKIYKKLLEGANFEDLAKSTSEDAYSAKKEGFLGRFASGKMVKEFDDVAFSIKKEGEISKPFKTRYGWHIIKLIHKYPIASFDKTKLTLTEKVKKDSRSKSKDFSIVHKLKKQYKITVNKKALAPFLKKNWKSSTKKLNKTLLTIQKSKINQRSFANYLGKNEYSSKLFKKFVNDRVLAYYINDIENNNSNFKNTYKEYKEGLLLFEILKNKIWEKSKDSVGIQKYFKANQALYQKEGKPQELDAVKGKVINDYQEYLEKQWIEELRNTYTIKKNKKAIREVIKQ